MATLDDRVSEAAALTDNVISRAKILKLGATDEWIEAKLARKVFQTLFAGVYLHGAADPTWRQWVRGALMAAGKGAVVSHGANAALRRVQGAEEGTIHITIPDNRDVDVCIVGHTDLEDLPTIKVYRSRRGTGPKSLADGIEATCIERMLVDYAAVASRLLVERAVEDVLNRGLSTETKIWRGLIRYGGRGVDGTKRLREVLLKRPAGRPAKSILEIFVGHALERAGIKPSVRNHRVTVDGKNYEIDRAWLREMVALEADSKAWHRTATATASDRLKDAALESIGFTVVRANWDETVNHPEVLIAKLELAFCEGSSVHNTEKPSQK